MPPNTGGIFTFGLFFYLILFTFLPTFFKIHTNTVVAQVPKGLAEGITS